MTTQDKQGLFALGGNLDRLIWQTDLAGLPAWRSGPLVALRMAAAIARDLTKGQLTLWAMSLVYTTLLSLVPLLAISFSILKGFGVHNQIEPMLLSLLEPMGEKGVEISERIVEFVDNVKVGVLGSLGFAMLFYTVISLMQKIERAFNTVWHVSQARSIGQRFRDYLSVLVIGPALVFAAVGIGASIASLSIVGTLSAIEPLGSLINFAGKLIPFLMISAAFSFMYAFIPNTNVEPRAAISGGLAAGLMWNLLGWIFASFVVGSAKYTAIYSTFATLMFFMIWLYVGWLILLIGANIAFYVQHPAYLRGQGGRQRLSHRAREKLALTLITLIAQHHYRDLNPWSAEALSQELRIRNDPVRDVLDVLEQGKLIKATADRPPTYLPARPFEIATADDVLAAIRHGGNGGDLSYDRIPGPAGIDQVLHEFEAAISAALARKTVKQMALTHGKDGPPDV
ncbi:MAG: YihY/virulence factor BrkB family protein [Rhodospirillaceae bacterium]|jgi:membrane protein|nr:YihY/virulence factor BrkB family protein [Rhodospirillaceae bacterium]MBT4690712.1 YihY/virulence factor BrkB family protein [Rhodospirillaceae bacterium]MBT5079106.1 YihY/virulence factor BrkB family protein [Rhodospirillaceae bacterium]MBT5522762.1 YihY/virulence factor BrkB family protein [Rhodospirillaceae bacterium]MBT5878972.1 YihY/virulence factor BrkB family protein [Rhodospirillaceae bacterium]